MNFGNGGDISVYIYVFVCGCGGLGVAQQCDRDILGGGIHKIKE